MNVDQLPAGDTGRPLVLGVVAAFERLAYFNLLTTVLLTGDGLTRDQIFPTFLGTSVFMTAFGGFVADFMLGRSRAALAGACILCVGCVLAVYTEKVFVLLGLLCVAIGVGFFRPAVTALVAGSPTRTFSRDGNCLLLTVASAVGACAGALSAYSLIPSGFTVAVGPALGASFAAAVLLLFATPRRRKTGVDSPTEPTRPRVVVPILLLVAGATLITALRLLPAEMMIDRSIVKVEGLLRGNLIALVYGSALVVGAVLVLGLWALRMVGREPSSALTLVVAAFVGVATMCIPACVYGYFALVGKHPTAPVALGVAVLVGSPFAELLTTSVVPAALAAAVRPYRVTVWIGVWSAAVGLGEFLLYWTTMNSVFLTYDRFRTTIIAAALAGAAFVSFVAAYFLSDPSSQPQATPETGDHP